MPGVWTRDAVVFLWLLICASPWGEWKETLQHLSSLMVLGMDTLEMEISASPSRLAMLHWHIASQANLRNTPEKHSVRLLMKGSDRLTCRIW